MTDRSLRARALSLARIVIGGLLYGLVLLAAIFGIPALVGLLR
jgi:hypothetical protein